MNHSVGRNTLLEIPLIEEKYGRFFFASIGFHGLIILLIFFGGYFLRSEVVLSNSGAGPGGGQDGPSLTVDTVANLPLKKSSGGDGMTKPSPVDQPPVRKPEPRVEDKNSIHISGPPPKAKTPKPKNPPNLDDTDNRIPTNAKNPGNGGNPSNTSGRGGGRGGGMGVDNGMGSGGVAGSYYSQAIVDKISNIWAPPSEKGIHIEIVYSFYIAANGAIYDIKKEKSCGNELLDLDAKRAIDLANPFSPPPEEFRGVKLNFRFVYPPNP
jgi:TonB family protein